ncbi:MAG: PAS domain S-box protein [Alphaproteobacteria bacterium]|nr:PAS domain S-box protein [Alphaproteobacteria bacterium]
MSGSPWSALAVTAAAAGDARALLGAVADWLRDQPGVEAVRVFVDEVPDGAWPLGVHGALAVEGPGAAALDAPVRAVLDAATPRLDAAVRLSRLESLFTYASDGIFISDGRGRYVDGNAQGLRMFGYTLEELRERTMLDLLPAGEERPRVELLLAGERVVSERRFLRKDGSTFVGEITAKMLPDGTFLGIVRDIDDRRQVEAQERRNARLEAVGQLAGGVAHDFNNLLTVISGQAELTELSLPSGHAARERIHRVIDACQRGRRMSDRLLAYARRNPRDPRPIAVCDVLRRVEAHVRTELPPSVSLEARFTPDCGSCVVDAAELEHALLDLVRNACEAMPGGGQLLLAARSASESSEHTSLKLGPCVIIEVRDTGVGIPEALRERVLEPFFSTKETGRNTGIGLALVSATMADARGLVQIESTEGVGTCVTLFLPRAETPPATEPEVPAEAPRRASVLVAEDDASVLEVVVRGLRVQGFDVAGFDDPREALAAFQRDPLRWSLVVSDVRMPWMTGPELLRRIRADRADLPALLVSGYADRAELEAARARDPILGKPFSLRQLVDAVRQRLADDAG